MSAPVAPGDLAAIEDLVEAAEQACAQRRWEDAEARVTALHQALAALFPARAPAPPLSAAERERLQSLAARARALGEQLVGERRRLGDELRRLRGQQAAAYRRDH